MSRSLLKRAVMEFGPDAVYALFTDGELEHLESIWEAVARPEQLPPTGRWFVWLILAGRGWGKTRTGAETTNGRARQGLFKRGALIGPTASDVRDVMIEGESGIKACSPPGFYPDYKPSRRLIVYPNGVRLHCYSAEEPERLRGPQHDFFWADELAAWKYSETWTQLKFGMRIGKSPQGIITTTPKPRKFLRRIYDDSRTAISHGSTRDNSENLTPEFLAEIVKEYEGTPIGEQEIEARLLDEKPGALWERAKLDEHRVIAKKLERDDDFNWLATTVNVDPPISVDGAEAGITVTSLGSNLHGYVRDDLSAKMKPEQWARAALDAYIAYGADWVVAEKNQGGEMVESTIRLVYEKIVEDSDDDDFPELHIKLVHASKGKMLRAEPVSALYGQGKVHHVGTFGDLEDQMCNYDGSPGDTSPDRLDSLVYGITHLMVKKKRKRKHKIFSAIANVGERRSPGEF